ncbi:MAG TPA: prepilin-type N-terminal cleavage/methylation domain-containing protein [Terriglobales bacterium]|jgi:Tfp pilus assembly protein PilW|nr:prepilin-type N-terminal cleavage/methylation domain-containing protein [Terriglobales bacterium]
MSDRSTKRASGFSLLEMTIAMALGTLVLGAAVQVYIQGVQATWTTTQRAELQQDFRAASNTLTTDLSLAGAGLGPGAAIALPSGTSPVYGCAQTGASPEPCYLGSANATSVKYPVQGTTSYLYGLLPGYNDGPTLLTAQGATDATTVVYTDNTFYLDCYTATITSATQVTFTLPGTTSPNCTANGNTIQNVNDSAVGLTAGDLVLFTFGGTNVVAEVTTAATSGGVATFAGSDALNMNQANTVNYSLAYQFKNGTLAGYANRILVISYYIDNTLTPSRLMRQVSGHTPAPVAENVVYMKFTYDLFNDTSSTAVVNCSNPGAVTDGCSGNSTNLLPNQITKINIQNMAMDSTLLGSQFGAGNGYQRMDLQTSVSARNLTFVNNYPN